MFPLVFERAIPRKPGDTFNTLSSSLIALPSFLAAGGAGFEGSSGVRGCGVVGRLAAASSMEVEMNTVEADVNPCWRDRICSLAFSPVIPPPTSQWTGAPLRTITVPYQPLQMTFVAGHGIAAGGSSDNHNGGACGQASVSCIVALDAASCSNRVIQGRRTRSSGARALRTRLTISSATGALSEDTSSGRWTPNRRS